MTDDLRLELLTRLSLAQDQLWSLQAVLERLDDEIGRLRHSIADGNELVLRERLLERNRSEVLSTPYMDLLEDLAAAVNSLD
jgi:hypothetical protein